MVHAQRGNITFNLTKIELQNQKSALARPKVQLPPPTKSWKVKVQITDGPHDVWSLLKILGAAWRGSI